MRLRLRASRYRRRRGLQPASAWSGRRLGGFGTRPHRAASVAAALESCASTVPRSWSRTAASVDADELATPSRSGRVDADGDRRRGSQRHSRERRRPCVGERRLRRARRPSARRAALGDALAGRATARRDGRSRRPHRWRRDAARASTTRRDARRCSASACVDAQAVGPGRRMRQRRVGRTIAQLDVAPAIGAEAMQQLGGRCDDRRPRDRTASTLTVRRVGTDEPALEPDGDRCSPAMLDARRRDAARSRDRGPADLARRCASRRRTATARSSAAVAMLAIAVLLSPCSAHARHAEHAPDPTGLDRVVRAATMGAWSPAPRPASIPDAPGLVPVQGRRGPGHLRRARPRACAAGCRTTSATRHAAAERTAPDGAARPRRSSGSRCATRSRRSSSSSTSSSSTGPASTSA